jgi:transposase
MPLPVGLHRDANQRDRFERLIEQLASRTYPYEPKESKPIDWSSYTQAQVRELNDTLELIRDAVNTVALPSAAAGDSVGRPRENTAQDLAKIVLMQAYFGCSNRLAAGYALVFREKLDLEKDMNYKAIERAYDDPQVRRIIQGVFDLTQEPVKNRVTGFTVDGSGLPRDAKGNWERDKQTKEAKRERFDGSIVMLTIPDQIITAHVSFPVGFGSESPLLHPLVHQTLDRYDGKLHGILSADAAFLGRENCEVIEQAGATPRIYPKRGIRLQHQGLSAWRRMLNQLIQDPQTWLGEYHQRSLSEAGWSRHKRRHGKLRKLRVTRRDGEKAARFTVDNLSRLACLRTTEGVSLRALRPPAAG